MSEKQTPSPLRKMAEEIFEEHCYIDLAIEVAELKINDIYSKLLSAVWMERKRNVEIIRSYDHQIDKLGMENMINEILREPGDE